MSLDLAPLIASIAVPRRRWYAGPVRPIVAAAVALGLAAGCGGDGSTADASGVDAEPSERPLTMADVLAPVTPAELVRVDEEWAGRDLGVHDLQVVATGTVTLGTVAMTWRVLAHRVEGSLHYGVVLVPVALTSPGPVLVYAHGGFTGEGGFPYFEVEDLASRIPAQPVRDRLVYVIPAYRGERIRIAGTTYTAEGTTLIGTTDLGDTAALLSAVVESTPLADGARVGVFGESRGAMVALSLAARDPRFDLVLDAFGPTDFRLGLAGIEPAAFDAAVAAAVAAPADPANLLVRSLIPVDQVRVDPDSTLTITSTGFAEMRRRMAATSALANPLALPATEVHHGTADPTASVEYSRALRDAMAAAGRPSPSDAFTYYEYPGGTHDLASLPGAIERMAAAVTRELDP
jgi:pimeloyl-ACP methyl ester carboxylesterase